MGLASQPSLFWQGLRFLPGANRARPRAGLSGVACSSQQSSTLRTSGHGGPAQKMGLDLPGI